MQIYLDTHNEDFPAGKGPRRAMLEKTETRATFAGSCPACGAKPFAVAGKRFRTRSDDRGWESDGYCLECKAPVGTIVAMADTIFGVAEDDRVLHGRCRVY